MIMNRMGWVAASVAVSMLGVASAVAAPEPVSRKEQDHWRRSLIPLPQEIAIDSKITLPVSEVRVHLRNNANDVERHAARRLIEVLGTSGASDDSAGHFELLIGVVDDRGRLKGVDLGDEVSRLKRLPHADQAYVIRPADGNRLVLAALSERGVFYASQTMCQLLANRLRNGEVTVPLARVTDWPDLAHRGLWGFNLENEIESMAGYKLNVIEMHVDLQVTEDGRGTASFRGYERPDFASVETSAIEGGRESLPERGRLRALDVVPIITHLDHLQRTGIYNVYPELMGKGKQARKGKGDQAPLAPCFSQPKLTEILADWMVSLSAPAGVTDICSWLTEVHVQCGCDKCQAVGQYVLEARSIVKAYRNAQARGADAGLRILLTQGSYATNDRILAEIPEDIGVTYYDGGRTYDSSRRPMIYPLLEEFAAEGGWLGVYPQLTASWRIVCPWTAPQFIRFRMNEFVAKQLQCVCGYATPVNQLYDFNITATAEWLWNADGRDEHEFATAWATHQGISDPDVAADWAVMLGPVGWDVYGARVPYHLFGQAARMIEERRPPQLGKGMFAYFPTARKMEENLAVCEEAMRIARSLERPELIAETQVIQGFVMMTRSIYIIPDLMANEGTPKQAEARKLDAALRQLDAASRQTTAGLRAWEKHVAPGKGGERFDRIMSKVEQAAADIARAVKEERRDSAARSPAE